MKEARISLSLQYFSRIKHIVKNRMNSKLNNYHSTKNNKIQLISKICGTVNKTY